jgi:hypothetical protein
MKELLSNNLHLYEVVPENVNAKIAFDIDVKDY